MTTDLSNMTLTFGKHYGKTFKEVAEKEKSYLDFVYITDLEYKNEDVQKNFNDFKEYITPLMKDQLLKFSKKHKDKSFEYVKNTEASFIDYMKSLKDVKSNNIKAFIKFCN